MDQTYQVLKRANEIAKPGGGDGRGGPVVRVSAPEEPPPARSPARPTAGLAVAPQPVSSSSGLVRHPDLLASRLDARSPPTVRVAQLRRRRVTVARRLRSLKPLVFSRIDLFARIPKSRAQGGGGVRSILSGACR